MFSKAGVLYGNKTKQNKEKQKGNTTSAILLIAQNNKCPLLKTVAHSNFFCGLLSLFLF